MSRGPTGARDLERGSGWFQLGSRTQSATGSAFNFKFQVAGRSLPATSKLSPAPCHVKKQTKTAGSSAIKQALRLAPYCILVVSDLRLAQYAEGPLLVCAFVALGAILVTVVSLLLQVEAAVSLTGFPTVTSESDSESDPARGACQRSHPPAPGAKSAHHWQAQPRRPGRSSVHQELPHSAVFTDTGSTETASCAQSSANPHARLRIAAHGAACTMVQGAAQLGSCVRSIPQNVTRCIARSFQRSRRTCVRRPAWAARVCMPASAPTSLCKSTAASRRPVRHASAQCSRWNLGVPCPEMQRFSRHGSPRRIAWRAHAGPRQRGSAELASVSA